MKHLGVVIVLAALATSAAAEKLPRLGMQVDVGVPNAAGATVVYRPWWWLRADAGLAYDYVGYGARAGVTLVPVMAAVTPTLDLDVGHFFTGDASAFASQPDSTEATLLRDAVYDFASAQLGFEFGSQRRFSFYMRGGVSYVTAAANGETLTALLNAQLDDKMLEARVGDVRVRALLPCASVGVNVYFY